MDASDPRTEPAEPTELTGLTAARRIAIAMGTATDPGSAPTPTDGDEEVPPRTPG
ncbi:hypothetical protein GCM10009836_38450 [Pseudonocardia ailaonensis]|uniref:Uncharacterized protein n=1 Tax=Pseudonocardia ailaonensis TaxID=367279 RepID=A0ABN2NAI0_9PSEU